MNLKIGDIIIVQSDTVVGRTIRWVTRSWASHVAVYIGDGLVFEAKPSRSGYVSLSKYQSWPYKYRVYRLKTEWENVAMFVERLLTKEGRKYDFWQIGYLLILSLFGLRNRVFVKTSKNRSICSEVIFEALAEAGIKWPKWKQPNVVPGDFESWELLERIY